MISRELMPRVCRHLMRLLLLLVQLTSLSYAMKELPDFRLLSCRISSTQDVKVWPQDAEMQLLLGRAGRCGLRRAASWPVAAQSGAAGCRVGPGGADGAARRGAQQLRAAGHIGARG